MKDNRFAEGQQVLSLLVAALHDEMSTSPTQSLRNQRQKWWTNVITFET